MFEDRTYDSLLQEKLDTVDGRYDKREGSIIYDALAPNSAEDAQVYITLAWMYSQQSGETASRENLIKIALDTRGISPYGATYAQLKGVFNIPVEIGERFSIDEYNYAVTELLDSDDNTYILQCETAGTDGNKRLGTLIPINYIAGLTSAELTEVLVYARDEEDTEAFRQRWRESFNTKSFGGNKADYIEKITAINGVGGVKVERCTNAAGEMQGGHVRCTIISSNYGAPSSELVERVQTVIDPEVNQGEGDGLAPIGAVVTICPVNEFTIDIETSITYEDGYGYEDIKSLIEAAVDKYFKSLSETWSSSSSGLVVRISMLESSLLSIAGIIDISGTMLNGLDENIILDGYSIPVRGDFNG
jgi:uncharacterized phage protein gp47/JayE